MPSFIFDNCCGCVELRKGCIILGYLNLVGIIIIMPLISMGLIGGGSIAFSDDPKMEKVGKFLMAEFIASLIILLIYFVFTVYFLIGIYKNKREYVKVFIIANVVSLAIFTIAIPFQEVNFIDVFSKITSVVINVYFLLVIRSYYLKMNDDDKKADIPIDTSKQYGEAA